MSSKKEKPAILAAVKEMNYQKVVEVLETQGIIKDNSWLDYLCLLFAVFPKNVKPSDWRSNTINIIKLLLKSGCRVRGPKTNKFCTPLYYAVQSMERDKKQALQIIEILLEAGASITDKDKNEDTPLQLAMKNKKTKAIEMMLSKYDVKNINVQNRDEEIHFVIACIKNRWPLVEEFIKKGMKVDGTIDSALLGNLEWPKNSTLLHIAVRNEAACVVTMLLKYGANFTVQDENQQSPLHVAYYSNEEKAKETHGCYGVRGKFDEMIDSILSAHTKSFNNPVDKKGLSHFHIACMRGDTAVVKNFLTHGVDMKKLSSTNASSDTFLNMAVKMDNQELVKILIQYGADVNGKGSAGQTPLNLAIKSKYNEIVEILLNLGANICIQDDKGNSPIHNAYFSLPDTKKLLDQLLMVRQGKMTNLCNKDGLSVFHIACALGKIDMVKNFIKNKVDVNACVSRNSKKSSGFTALHFAVSSRNKALVKLLMKHNANIEAVNKEGVTPVMMAIESPPKCKQVCVSIKSNLRIETEACKDASGDEDELIDLIYKEFKHMEIVQLFIQKKCNLNHVDKKGKPLLFRAFLKLVEDFPDTFTDYGSIMDEGEKDDRIKTICINFFINNFQDTMNLLIDNNVDVNARDKEGNCIFHHIIDKMKYRLKSLQLETTEMFLKKGADADVQNKDGQLPINKAVHDRNTKLLELFLKYNVNPNSTDEKDGTPLHVAAYYSCNDHRETTYYDMIKLLLENGADINSRNSNDRTPIFEACKWGNRGDAMQLLLQSGADVTAKDKDGRTALFAAVLHNNDRCVKLLLDYGVDITVKDKYGMSIFKKLFTYFTPSNVSEKRFKHVVAVLETHMRKLQLLGRNLSRSDLLYCKRLKYAYGKGLYPKDLKDLFKEEKNVDLDIFDEDGKLTAELKKELKKMKATPIDKYIWVYDILFKDLDQMKNYIKNEDFKKCLNKEMFPHFGDMLHLKFNQASSRCSLLESAQKSFQFLTKKKMPDSCLYGIFDYLNNEDLLNLINIRR